MTRSDQGPEWDDEPAVLEELGRALGHDSEAEPPPDRVAAIRAAAVHLQAGGLEEPRRRPDRRFLLAGGVAAGVGGIAGFLTRGSDEQEPESPPTEQIRFSGDADVTMSALINHTWGTELLLDLSGLMPGTEYDVVFETRGGTAAAGSLLAVDGVVMKCRFNAAPLRADVLAIELRGPDGAAVLHSTLPQA